MGKVQLQALLQTIKTSSVLALGFMGPPGSFEYLHTLSTSDRVSSGCVAMYQIILYKGLVQLCTWYCFLLKIVFGQLTYSYLPIGGLAFLLDLLGILHLPP